MTHPLVEQLRFSRSEFKRALEGLSEEDAVKRVLPANCIAWNIGHLAWQEQRYWLIRGSGKTLRDDVNRQFAYGAEAARRRSRTFGPLGGKSRRLAILSSRR